MPVRAWGELTTTDFADPAIGRAVAVLPVAATEQHGPHLPLATDSLIAEGYLGRLPAFVAAEVEVLVLPVQSIGKSDEHDAFPGTLTLSAATALAAWTEIGAGIAAAGCRRLAIVTSHGGNSALIDLVAGEIRRRHGLAVATTSWSRLGYPEGLFPAGEIAHGIHAGGIETALMLALRPDLVRRAKLADFPSKAAQWERDYAYLRAGRPAALAWKTQDLNPAGALGDARLGTAEAGEALLDHGARAFAALLADLARFPAFARDGNP